jgi:hypothetical protein
MQKVEISVRESCVEVDFFLKFTTKSENFSWRELCRGGKNRIFDAKSGKFS